MIEEYDRDKEESDTEDIMRDKAEGIDRARDESEAKSISEYDMRKQVWKEKSFGLRNYKTAKPRRGGSSLRQKARSVRLKRGPMQKLI